MRNTQPTLRLLGIAAAVVLATNSQAADINVPNDQPTIQAGINAANPGDVVIVAQGEYFENINFNGKAITVRSTDPNDAGAVMSTIINGGGSGRVVTCDSGEGLDTVLSGFVITGGNASSGGGMFNYNSSPTVTNCTFSGNTAANFGGGMVNGNNNPIVTNCTFSNNSSGIRGGGMSNGNSNPNVTNCTFSGNATKGGGGGMYNSFTSNPNVTNCSFIGNAANVSGGGMYNDDSSPTLINCTFSDNAAANGGGMLNFLGSSPTLTNCTFDGNTTAGSGGGMYSVGYICIPTLTNCTFSANTAGNDGGGMYNDYGSSPTVINCTFSGNTAGNDGGGIYNAGVGDDPTLTNCILWGNSASGTGDEIVSFSYYSTISYSNIKSCGGSGVGWDASLGNDGGGNVDADPLFVGPADLRLLASSPSIDGGDSMAVPPGTTTDAGGNPRFVDDPCTVDGGLRDGSNPMVDMGAYEFQVPCRSDVDCNGTVNVLDLIDVLLTLGSSGGPTDINQDGSVNDLDLIDLLSDFGLTCPLS